MQLAEERKLGYYFVILFSVLCNPKDRVLQFWLLGP